MANRIKENSSSKNRSLLAWASPVMLEGCIGGSPPRHAKMGAAAVDDSTRSRRLPQTGIPAGGRERLQAEGVDRAEGAGAAHLAGGEAGGGEGEQLAGEVVAVASRQAHAGQFVAGGVAGHGDDQRSGASASGGVRSLAGALERLLAALLEAAARARQGREQGFHSGDGLEAAAAAAEPAEVDVYLGQLGRQPGQGELLARAEGDGRQAPAAVIEVVHPPGDPLGDQPAAPEGVLALPGAGGEGGSRAAAHPGRTRVAGQEVADLDPPQGRTLALVRTPGGLDGECPGEVARNEVVAEGGEQRRAVPLGPGPELGEDPADEGCLAGAVG